VQGFLRVRCWRARARGMTENSQGRVTTSSNFFEYEGEQDREAAGRKVR